ncbi:MAG: NUDIX domain-containing protein [Defluviitaleaceae bacterium]|nr:NUDIX domain-containing protein [Defluviitaleaceae bacterium]
MTYVEDLRSIIGHKLIILNGSITFIQNDKGQILLQQRTYPHGTWGLPGGLMELGESTEQTARREVQEETGLTLGKLTLLGIYSGENYLCKAQNGDEFYVVTTAYTTADYIGEVVVNDNESLRLEWFNIKNLPEPIERTHQEIIKDYIKKTRNH